MPTASVTRYRAKALPGPAAELGESPLWVPATQHLRWLDIPQRTLHTRDADGHVHSRSLTEEISAIELGPQGYLTAVARDFGFARIDPRNNRVIPMRKVPLPSGTRLNDAAVDPVGRCWAGTASRDSGRDGELFRLDPDGQVSRHLQRLGMSNGLDWAPDGRTLYHADSTAGSITAYTFHVGNGTLDHPCTLRQIPPMTGLPDGLTVDAQGNIWVAIWGAAQVWQLAPDSGALIGVVELPTPRPTSCIFGGSDLRTLFMTTAHTEGGRHSGLLYEARVAVAGRPPRVARHPSHA